MITDHDQTRIDAIQGRMDDCIYNADWADIEYLLAALARLQAENTELRHAIHPTADATWEHRAFVDLAGAHRHDSGDVDRYADLAEVMADERDEARALAKVGTWHDGCRPNREMAARELLKSQAVIDKLADRITELEAEVARLHAERDQRKNEIGTRIGELGEGPTPQHAAEALAICERCQMRLPERLVTFGIGVRGGAAARCAACNPQSRPDGEAKRAEVVAMRKARR